MIIVPEHRLKSRPVKEADVPRVLADVEEMKKLFTKETLAIAHPQVDDKDPLAFFLTAEGEIVINPWITRHVNYFVESIEGCMTYPDRRGIVHPRWHKIDIECQTIVDGKLSDIENTTVSGKDAFMIQHEIDHLNGIYCYDEIRTN